MITLGLDTKGLEQGQQNALGSMRGFVTKMIAGYASIQAVMSYASQADSIGKLSNAIGINMQDMQAWGEAVSRAGGSADAFLGSLKGLNRQVQTIATFGKGRGADVYKQLGISVSQNGKARDTIEILRDLAGAGERMDKVQFQGLMQRLGLDEGTIMLLQSGRTAVDDLVARQKSLGVYTEEDAQITADFNDALADMKQSAKALSAIFMRVVVPPLKLIFGVATDIIQLMRRHKTLIIGTLTAIGIAMKTSLVAGVKSLSLAFAGLITTISPLLPIIAGIAALILVIDDLATYAQGGESAFADLWASLFGTPDELMKKWGSVTAVFETLCEAMKSFGKIIADVFSYAFDWVSKVYTELKSVKLSELFSGLGEKLLTPFKELKESFTNWVDEPIKKLEESFKNFKISEVLKGWLKAIVDWAGRVVDLVIEKISAPLKNFFEGLIPNWLKRWLDSGDSDRGGSGGSILSIASNPAREAVSEVVESRVNELSYGAVGKTVNNDTKVNVDTVNITTSASTLEGVGEDFTQGVYLSIDALGTSDNPDL